MYVQGLHEIFFYHGMPVPVLCELCEVYTAHGFIRLYNSGHLSAFQFLPNFLIKPKAQ